MSQRVGAKRRPMTGSATCGNTENQKTRMSLRSSGYACVQVRTASIGNKKRQGLWVPAFAGTMHERHVIPAPYFPIITRNSVFSTFP